MKDLIDQHRNTYGVEPRGHDQSTFKDRAWWPILMAGFRYNVFTEAPMSTIGSNIIRERVHGRRRDLGDGFSVSRVLPAARQPAVGPFVLMDHMGL